MGEPQTTKIWRQTACNLCYINCGIEVITEGRRIVKVRGDKAHPDTRGFACQKAQRLDYYQNQADRLTLRCGGAATARSSRYRGRPQSLKSPDGSSEFALNTAAMPSPFTAVERRVITRTDLSRSH
jgi:hypothetical protein